MMMGDPSEIGWPELLERLQGSRVDELAWREAVERLRLHAVVAIGSLPHDAAIDAHDLAIELLLKLLDPSSTSSAALKVAETARFPDAYIRAMVRNAVISRLRKQIVERRALAAVAQLREAEESKLFLPEDFEALHRELHRLTPQERELLRLRFWEKMSIDLIAKRFGLSHSATSVRLFRLVRKLRAILEGRGPMPNQ